MGVIGVWSYLAILYQTFLCVIISWLTLGCRFAPDSTELAEVSLLKLLYLYDPEACGRIHFYNISSVSARASSAVIWPVRNHVAAAFRSKMKVWLALHVIWATLATVNMSQGSRRCSYYLTLLPFTITGICLLFVDVVFCTLFLMDIPATATEPDILNYINRESSVLSTSVSPQWAAADTSWAATALAYCSLRAVLQWLLNFWIVKDTHCNGRALYRQFQQMAQKEHARGKSVQMYKIRVDEK